MPDASNEQPVVETPPVETPAPQKVTFSDEQKSRINEIVREASQRAGAEGRAEAERLRKLIPATPTEPTDTLLKLAEATAELASLKSQAAENQITQVLHKAVSKENFFDTDLAAQILRSSIKMVDNKPVIIDASGAVRLNSSFEPMSLEEAVTDLAVSKKYLVRSDFVGGAGSVMNTHHQEPGPPLASIFGAKSDGGAAQRLAMKSPKIYAAMKVRARAAGLIP